jgi:hypothetical protein
VAASWVAAHLLFATCLRSGVDCSSGQSERVFLCVLLGRYFRHRCECFSGFPHKTEHQPARLAKRFEFSPADLGGFSWQSLALWSLLSLFMELLMIRWISSEVRIFAYFKNFVLIACFLGFGLVATFRGEERTCC